MSDYAIGDIQGCFKPLMRLLELVSFNPQRDRLWLVGDLVNRGPDSLEVLRFIKNLPIPAQISLGNHDLHLLRQIFNTMLREDKNPSLAPILEAYDCEALGHWLRQQPFLCEDQSLGIVSCHAGIYPLWTLAEARAYAAEAHQVLAGEHYQSYLDELYGNEPDQWSDSLQGMERLRLITNCFTRMRFCDAKGALLLDYKGGLDEAPATHLPWFSLPQRIPLSLDLIFGHWAALNGHCEIPGIYALDTGCVWGRQLTALRLQDRQLFSIPCAPPFV